MKARKFWTRERLLTLPERRETTRGTAMVATLSDVTMMARGEEEDVAEAVEVPELVVAEEVPEVGVERESLTGSPGTAGPASRLRRREEAEARETGATLRMM